MRRYILKFLACFVVTVLLSVVYKIVFVLLHHALYAGTGFTDVMAAIWHGLPMDMSVAGYVTAVPGLLLLTASLAPGSWLRGAERIYFTVIAMVLGLVMTLDAGLYSFWGFKLDMTPVFYFLSSPAAVVGGMSAVQCIGLGVIWALASVLIYQSYRFGVMHRRVKALGNSKKRFASAGTMLVLTAALFIPIRGGFTVSTMNLSSAYFSQNQRLNHAAINPAFSLLYSATHTADGGDKLSYFDAAAMERLMPEIVYTLPSPEVADSAKMLTTQRPDVICIILESFSAHLLPSLGGEAIAVNLDSIAGEGVLFTNMYANSFRTDRALPSIFNGYPGIPPVSVMKYVDKIELLPSWPLELKKADYGLNYYYGGDINFTNMNALLVSGGFENIVRDKDFPVSQRLGKWGAHDDMLLQRVAADIAAEKPGRPQLRVIQTSSSHEPFEVPYTKLQDPATNAFAFTDSVVGSFIRELSHTAAWDSTLVILVPDHYGAYPRNLEPIAERHHIPLILTGGALKQRGTLDMPASQMDIAATLLGMLGIDHSQFRFSRDLLDPAAPKLAYFAEPETAAMITPDGEATINVVTGEITDTTGDPAVCDRLKAMLQMLADDFARH